MTTRKRKRSEKMSASKLSAPHDTSSTSSLSNPQVDVATRRIRKSAPIEKLINIFELYEQVLSHLPMDDLLHAMQVCRTLKLNIENSSRLQKEFISVPDFERKIRSVITSRRTLLSGAKAAQHIAAAEAAGEEEEEEEEEKEKGEVTFYTPHPSIRLHERGLPITHPGLVSYAVSRVFYHHPSGRGNISAFVLSSADIWSRKRTSLENMLLTQPPIKRLQVSEGDWPWSKKQDVFVETGVFKTMRALRAPGVPDVLSFYEESTAASSQLRARTLNGIMTSIDRC
jgi:hypothetical protein